MDSMPEPAVVMPGTAYWMLVEVDVLVEGAENCTFNGLLDKRTESTHSEERIVCASSEAVMGCAISKM